jgi:hypothetical protein
MNHLKRICFSVTEVDGKFLLNCQNLFLHFCITEDNEKVIKYNDGEQRSSVSLIPYKDNKAFKYAKVCW